MSTLGIILLVVLPLGGFMIMAIKIREQRLNRSVLRVLMKHPGCKYLGQIAKAVAVDSGQYVSSEVIVDVIAQLEANELIADMRLTPAGVKELER